MTVASIAVNGAVTPLGEAYVPVADRGFLYGDSAFEVIRTYQGKPFRLLPHLQRLKRSCDILGIGWPVSLAALVEEVTATRQHLFAQGAAGEHYLRVVITRGGGPLRYDPNTAEDPTRVIIAAPLPVLPAAAYSKGLRAVCLRVSRLVDDARGAGTKASNYLPNLLAVAEAQERGADEALVLGPHGEVLEGTTSNVFVVRDGHVTTTPLSTGILAGITRELALEALSGLALPFREAMLFPSDLYRADEVFITSSIRELVSLVQIDGAPVADAAPGPVATQVRETMQRIVERELDLPNPA